MTETELVVVGAAAILAGAVNSLAGGGTLITFSALLSLGVPAIVANVTNTIALCPGYLGGALAQFKDLSAERRSLYGFGITGAPGGVAGGILLLNTGEAMFRVLVPYFILLTAGLLAIEGPVHKWYERRVAHDASAQVNRVWKVFSVFLAAIYGGYFGGGLN
jgi:uncharacterized membrane protein YfcA